VILGTYAKGGVISRLKVVKLSTFGMWCLLANIPQNYNATGQRHVSTVCFSEDRKITVSCSKFSQKNISSTNVNQCM
jgi:hypothetical protein